jgi:selenocysteine lyase/cysteine desulfurase
MPTDTSAALLPQRDRFDIPEPITYLNCASMAPQLRVVAQAALDATRRNAAPWSIAPGEWFSESERLRLLFTQVVGSDPDGIAIIPSASYGIAVAAANVPVRAGEEVVVLDREFPSNLYAWRELTRGRDAGLRTVVRSAGETWTEATISAIHERGGGRRPQLPLDRREPRRPGRGGRSGAPGGAALVVDGSQSIGAVPLDLAAVRPDFLVTVGMQVAAGSVRNCLPVRRPGWRDAGQPIEHTWLHAPAARISPASPGIATSTDSARAVRHGWASAVRLTPMAIAALEQVLAWRVDRIHAMISTLVARLSDGVGRLLPHSADERGSGRTHDGYPRRATGCTRLRGRPFRRRRLRRCAWRRGARVAPRA